MWLTACIKGIFIPLVLQTLEVYWWGYSISGIIYLPLEHMWCNAYEGRSISSMEMLIFIQFYDLTGYLTGLTPHLTGGVSGGGVDIIIHAQSPPPEKGAIVLDL